MPENGQICSQSMHVIAHLMISLGNHEGSMPCNHLPAGSYSSAILNKTSISGDNEAVIVLCIVWEHNWWFGKYIRIYYSIRAEINLHIYFTREMNMSLTLASLRQTVFLSQSGAITNLLQSKRTYGNPDGSKTDQTRDPDYSKVLIPTWFSRPVHQYSPNNANNRAASVNCWGSKLSYKESIFVSKPMHKYLLDNVSNRFEGEEVQCRES